MHAHCMDASGGQFLVGYSQGVPHSGKQSYNVAEESSACVFL